ncbi:MAG: hypothetical protein ONB46_15095 [candidate division KSB1 bacterium]|nr:hypothetical protein [candidate division KSB1 bacterium]MDZ7366985.1 hypothetical protein [candidate division KSB1 bacterium]MDZ7406810.1 hypothetical protein [candidate division KSB1 bacterium]
MANHIAEATVTIGVKDLERLIRHAVRDEIARIVRKQPAIFYIEPKTPLYEDMKEITRMKRQGKIKLYSRQEAFGG